LVFYSGESHLGAQLTNVTPPYAIRDSANSGSKRRLQRGIADAKTNISRGMLQTRNPTPPADAKGDLTRDDLALTTPQDTNEAR
jgi:hypothetical protein